MKNTVIAIDAMGGDYGPIVTVPAACQVLSQHPHLELILVGNQEVLQQHLKDNAFLDEGRLSIVHASQHIENDELPSKVLRTKKDSAMRIAIELVKSGRAQACVSAGNTGALMAIAWYVLKMLPGVQRPAIMAAFPTTCGRGVHMLDLGANVDSSAENLYQFAVMGSIVVQAVSSIASPRVALLNVGSEQIKGNEQVKETARLISQNPNINYIGYIEGNDIFKGVADIVVCDGFVGNVALKCCEGVARMLKDQIKQSFMRNSWNKFIGLLSRPILQEVSNKLDPNKFNGASLLGLQGIVIKSHGNACVKAFSHAIEEAIEEVINNVPSKIRQQVEHHLDN